jgi:Uma2 family endonuclease
MAAPELTGRTPKQREPVMMTFAVDPSLVPDFEELEAFTRQLPETDGVPMESPWHFASIHLLIDILTYVWRDRNDFFCGGNMFLYYSRRHVRSEDFKGPDFFYVHGVDRQRPRRFWVVWEEGGKYPDLIIEHLSPSTAEADRTTKKELYEQTFHTPEYFCYDPDTRRLEGWNLVKGHYQALVPNERGWLWSNVLQLWLGEWVGEFQGQRGTWLRFYDKQGRLVPLQVEVEQQKAVAENLRAEAEKRRAEAEKQRAETEKERAETEKQQAEAEKQRAESAEAELAKLKASLAQKGIVLETPPEAP